MCCSGGTGRGGGGVGSLLKRINGGRGKGERNSPHQFACKGEAGPRVPVLLQSRWASSRALYPCTGSTNCGRLPHLSRKEPGSCDHHLDRFLLSRDQRIWMLKK